MTSSGCENILMWYQFFYYETGSLDGKCLLPHIDTYTSIVPCVFLLFESPFHERQGLDSGRVIHSIKSNKTNV